MAAAALRRLSFVVLAAAVLLLGTTVWLGQGRAAVPGNTACPSPQSIPAGFDYPQTATTVTGWVTSGNLAKTRSHGWNLWAALNAIRSGKPIWQSWCTETQAFAGQLKLLTATGHRAIGRGERPMRQFKKNNGTTGGSDPINFPTLPIYAIPPVVTEKYWSSGCVLPPNVPDAPLPTLANGPSFQNNGDVMIAGVIYNQTAYNWIRGGTLYQPGTLQKQWQSGPVQPSIADFPAGSIVLKPMMWPVQASGFTALPVWDDLSKDGDAYTGFEIQSQWKRAVAVTPTPQSTLVPASVSFLNGVAMEQTVQIDGKPRTVTLPLGPNTYTKPSVVGIDQFYHYRPNLAAMAPCDRAILDASAYYAYGREFRQGDYLILVAMHIMTKEQPAWTFQSVWWSDRPDRGDYAADRPAIPGAAGPWAHYLMTATYGIPNPNDGKQWPVAYNPYIELAADHPIRTNCMNCHHRAAWPGVGDEYQATGGPGALDIFAQNNPVVFNNRLKVDSLWSVSDRVPAPGNGATR